MRNEAEKQIFYYNLGEEYFWLSGHYDAAFFMIEPYLKDRQAKECSERPRILDAGCGPGNFISRIRNYGNVFGIDYSRDALGFCMRKHRISGLISNLESISVHDRLFDRLVSLEVLEHIENDVVALKEYFRIMKSGGVGLISVPAFQFLWGEHDKWFGHVRRYTKAELVSKLKEAGFTIISCHYFKCLFFIPMYLLRKIKQILKMYEEVQTDYIVIPKWLNSFLRWVILHEVKWKISSMSPFGTHLLCLFSKP